jgi:hypothetical protein
MPNTLGTTNAGVIAQEALKQLAAALPILGQIASDHTQDGAKFNETITVHEVTAAAAADFDPETGYVASARTITDIPVTINKHKHHTYSVNVQEASSSRVDLIKRLGLNAAYSIGSAVVADLCALITKASFTNETVIALGAGGDGFSRKGAVKLGTALSKRGVPGINRFALLNADYFGSLSMDDSLMNLIALTGGRAATDGNLPLVHKIAFSEFVDLPKNNGNLVGFAGARTALAFATRIPDDPCQGQPGVNIQTVRDEDTGLALQVREWCNPDLAQFKRTYTLMYGVAKGQVAALERLVDAASA